MGDEDDGEAELPPQRAHEFLQADTRERVDCAERLVHQQYSGAAGESARDRHALLHAARELPGIVLFKTRKLHEADEFARACGNCLPRQRLAALQSERHVALHRLPGEKRPRVLLKDVDDGRRRHFHLPVFEEHRTRRGRNESGHDLQQGRLAASGGADDGHEAAALDVEIDAIKRNRRAARRREGLAQAAYPQERPGGVRHRL